MYPSNTIGLPNNTFLSCNSFVICPCSLITSIGQAGEPAGKKYASSKYFIPLLNLYFPPKLWLILNCSDSPESVSNLRPQLLSLECSSP